MQGGAGAVGNAAIQLAVWAGATVITTVSSADKAELARNAGAHHVIDYREEDVAQRVNALVPGGVDLIVEVDLAANLSADVASIAPNGTIGIYTYGNGDPVAIPPADLLVKNVQLSFVYTYGTPDPQKDNAVAAVNRAVAAGALGVGAQHGLPLIRYPLSQTAQAHAAVERGVTGKVLIDVTPVGSE